MRTIKFRVWDKSIKKWMFGYEILGGFNFFGEVVLMGELSRISLDKLSNDGYAVMQYTGLKDKYGKEVYDDDILRTIDGIVKVSYVTGCFWVDGENNLSAPLYVYADEEDNWCEIIGNIHENPELL